MTHATRSVAVAVLIALVLLNVSCEAPLGTRARAEAGDANAQSLLGFTYRTGRGVPQDYAEAVRWYRLAADQGYARAQNKLGSMYANGRGVPQDHPELDQIGQIVGASLADWDMCSDRNLSFCQVRKLLFPKANVFLQDLKE